MDFISWLVAINRLHKSLKGPFVLGVGTEFAWMFLATVCHECSLSLHIYIHSQHSCFSFFVFLTFKPGKRVTGEQSWCMVAYWFGYPGCIVHWPIQIVSLAYTKCKFSGGKWQLILEVLHTDSNCPPIAVIFLAHSSLTFFFSFYTIGFISIEERYGVLSLCL